MMLPYSFRFFSHCSRSAFHLLLALLVRYRSENTYLDLEVDTPIFMPPTRKTLLFLDHSFSLRIRGYYSLWHGIPADFCSKKGYSPPHLLLHYCKRIQHDLTGFQSLLLTGSQLISFPLPTKMLHFRRLLHSYVHNQTPGSKTACVSPGRIAACRVVLWFSAKPSTIWFIAYNIRKLTHLVTLR